MCFGNLRLGQNGFSGKLRGNIHTDRQSNVLVFNVIAPLFLLFIICFQGHSAFIWLNSNKNIQHYSFDIGEHNYTKPAVKLIQSIFPGRLHIKYGDSRWTLPEFHSVHSDISCDLIVIDGGHYENVPQKDLENFREMASQSNLIILDDQPGSEYFKGSIDLIWKKLVDKRMVKELFVCKNDRRIASLDREKGMTLGRYI